MKSTYLAFLAAPAVVAALAWWTAPDDQVPAAAPAPTQAAVAESLWPQANKAAPQPVANLPLASSGTTAPTAAPVVRSAAMLDVCGLGRVSGHGTLAAESSAGLGALAGPVGGDALTAARERMLAALRGGPPQAQVAALMLNRPDTNNPSTAAAWATQVVQVALGSQSTAALAWAEEACGFLPDGQRCRVGLIRARLRAEPDNGVHWAALADEDPEAADEAWKGLQQAKRWHSQPQSLLLTSLQGMPADLPAYLRQSLGAEVNMRAVSLPQPGEGFMQERCTAGEANEDAGSTSSPNPPINQEACNSVAKLLIERSDGTQSLSQGVQLAQSLGWPAQRIASLQDELKSFSGPDAEWMPDEHQPLSCASTQAWQQHVDAIARSGELGALRSRLAARRQGS